MGGFEVASLPADYLPPRTGTRGTARRPARRRHRSSVGGQIVLHHRDGLDHVRAKLDQEIPIPQVPGEVDELQGGGEVLDLGGVTGQWSRAQRLPPDGR